MWTRLALLSILSATFIPGQPFLGQSLAIQHVTVIDATGRPAQPDMTVVLERDRIAAVTPFKKAKIPKNLRKRKGLISWRPKHSPNNQ